MKSSLAAVVWLIVSFGCVVAAPSQSLRISYSGVAGQNLAIWVTYEAGLFKKYGLNPEMLMIAGGVTNLHALHGRGDRICVSGRSFAGAGDFAKRRSDDPCQRLMA